MFWVNTNIMQINLENEKNSNGELTDNYTFRELEKLYFKGQTPAFFGRQFVESHNYAIKKYMETRQNLKNNIISYE